MRSNGPGNIASDGVNAYLYDAEDRLCAVHGAYGMVGYQYDAEGNRISKGSITVWSCDITSNGFQPQSDYILDQGGGQETEMAVAATGTEVWQHTEVWADGQLIATYNTERLRINELLPWNVSIAPTHTNPQNTCPHKIMWARIPKPPHTLVPGHPRPTRDAYDTPESRPKQHPKTTNEPSPKIKTPAQRMALIE